MNFRFSTNTARPNTAGSRNSPEFWLFQASWRSRLNSSNDQQGRRESNSQPLVLETSALPIELRPCGSAGPGCPNPARVTFSDDASRSGHRTNRESRKSVKNLRDNPRSDSSATFTNSEANAIIYCDWYHQLNFHLDVVAR